MPPIDVEQFYKKADGQRIHFQFLKRDPLKPQDIAKITGNPGSTLSKMINRATKEFTEEENDELIKVMNQKKVEDGDMDTADDVIDIQKFIAKKNFRKESTLQQIPDKVLALRCQLLLQFNDSFVKLFKLVRQQDVAEEGTISNAHVRQAHLAFPFFIEKIVDRAF